MSKQPNIKLFPLAESQYYKTPYSKRFIFLHHTAGGSAASAVNTWASDAQRVATPFVIERTGDIYQCFDPKYWAYSLGVKGATAIEKASIPIEIVSFGNLDIAKTDIPKTGAKKGDYIAWTGRPIPKEEVLELEFRNIKYWHRYTDAQIDALKELLPYLMDKFKISKQPVIKDFWNYSNPFALPMGIYSHTSVRKDKVDIFPQQNLIDLVYSL